MLPADFRECLSTRLQCAASNCASHILTTLILKRKSAVNSWDVHVECSPQDAARGMIFQIYPANSPCVGLESKLDMQANHNLSLPDRLPCRCPRSRDRQAFWRASVRVSRCSHPSHPSPVSRPPASQLGPACGDTRKKRLGKKASESGLERRLPLVRAHSCILSYGIYCVGITAATL